ncbi:Nn.00g095690.m01.CDS01 [Neocucurbitaria sp. VM-36]
MWKYALLGVPALLALGSDVDTQHKRDCMLLQVLPSVRSRLTPPDNASLAGSSRAPQFVQTITVLDYKDASSSIPSLDSSPTSLNPPRFTYAPSKALPPFSNTTTVHNPCTGCILQAQNAFTTFFDEEDISNPWTSVVVTETIVTQVITYFDGSTIDTIVTEQETVNQTKTLFMTEFNETITHTTPVFVVEPTPGVYLTLQAGPTYVVYDDLNGGVDQYIDSTYPSLAQTLRTCAPMPTKLKHWEPTATEDWSYFIQTYTGEPPEQPENEPVPLPSKLVEFLKQDPDIISQYAGADIATCTVGVPLIISGDPHRTTVVGTSAVPPAPAIPTVPMLTSKPASETETEPANETEPPNATAPSGSVTTGTFLSTTYESTSTHVTRQGCLRCDATNPFPNPGPTDGPVSNKINDPTPTHKPGDNNKPDDKPKPTPNNPNKPDDNKPKPNQQQTAPSIPDIIVSIIHNNPSIWPQHTTADQSVTIGNNVYPVHTANPTQNNDQPNEQNQAPPVILIGSETFSPGQTKTINGVPVVAPSDGGYSRLVVDGSTITIPTAGPTGGPVLTIGGNTVTANPEGQFVVGTQTLAPGSPAITVSGTAYSLGPSGTVLVVNGVSSTLANNNNNNNPAITAAPALTIDGKTYTATVQDGSAEYVLGAGTTLQPGDAVTISGTTYSLDPKGTALVVNGQTSSIQRVPASNSASTTRSSAASRSTTTSTTTSSSGRDAGDLIASGIGESSKAAGVSRYRSGGLLDKWVEGLVIGAAGWLTAFML